MSEQGSGPPPAPILPRGGDPGLNERRRSAHARPLQARVGALFQLCLGVIALVVFLSLPIQLVTLIGVRGLMPVGDYISRIQDPGFAATLEFPTLFWAVHSDGFIRALPWIGAALALLLIAGVAARWVALLLWAIFLSCIVAGRDFFWYQWDSLMLEALFLAVFLPGAGSLRGLLRCGSRRRPSAAIVFLYRWLLFRLLFESGLAKVFSGDDNWWNLTAMSYYYETAPLPSLGGWWIQQAPMLFHKFSVILTLLVELPLALLAFAPRRLRLVLFGANAVFQATIFLTANYGYFNPLSFAISLFLLEDRDLEWAAGLIQRAPVVRRLARSRPGRWVRRGCERIYSLFLKFRRTEGAPGGGHAAPAPADQISGARCATATAASGPVLSGRDQGRTSSGVREAAREAGLRLRRAVPRAGWSVLVVLVVGASVLEAAQYFVPRVLPRLADGLRALEPLRVYAPLRIVSKYHLFPGILRERHVIRILGTVDGRNWLPYALRHTPGEPDRPPPVTGLHNPRFAFHYSFLPMNRRRDLEYFNRLLERLCCDPEAVADLLEADPLDGKRPLGLKLDFYRYRFSDLEHRRRTGEYWLREYLGSHRRIVPCRCEEAASVP